MQTSPRRLLAVALLLSGCGGGGGTDSGSEAAATEAAMEAAMEAAAAEASAEGGADVPGSDTQPLDAPPPMDATAEASPSDSAAEAAPDAMAEAAVDVQPVDVPVVSYDGGMSNIRHVVVLWQENHTFDSYFGRYCTAPAGSNPTCTAGPACCERAPDMEPRGASPVTLDDTANGNYDPPHSRVCETSEINGGRMDRFVSGTACASSDNFALVPAAATLQYRTYASRYALADRYFQSLVGASSANDMYFAVARWVFDDNTAFPMGAPGDTCGGAFTPRMRFTGPTIADLLLDAGRTVGIYAEGINAARAITSGCPPVPTDCPGMSPGYPCTFDASDIPFLYYARFASSTTYVHDTPDFFTAVTGGTLPDVAWYRTLGYHSEHPGSGTRITDGAMSVDRVVQAIAASPYANDTLILVTWDEGGGYFDHVPPPPDNPVDRQPYGTRVPLLAIGRFARTNFVSHVTMEHSSIVRFLEWNFLHATGLLRARDGVVNNIGSLLDPAQTGVPVPEN